MIVKGIIQQLVGTLSTEYCINPWGMFESKSLSKGKQSYTWVDQSIRCCIMHVSLIYIIPRYGPDFATLLKLPASPVVVVFIQLFKAKSLSSKFADFSFFSRTILASWFDVFLSFDRFLPFFYLLIVSTFWSFYLLIILPFDRSTFCHSTLCHSTFCHSTFCRSAIKFGPFLNNLKFCF